MNEELKYEPINACDGYRRSREGDTIPDQSLSVRLTASCDNSCSFCIAAEDMKISHKFDKEALVKQTIDSGTDTVSIIGGEPFLFMKRLIEYLDDIRDKVESIYITTSLPITLERQWDDFKNAMSKIDFITISIQDMDYARNNDLMNSKKKFDRVSLLKRILEDEDLNEKVTVNMNLVKEGIDTEDSFFEALYLLDDWGLKHLRINELMHAPKQYVNFEEMLGLELPPPYSGGCKTKMHFIDGMDIYLKRSCFMTEETLGATEEEVDKLEYKAAHVDSYMQPGWRILYEHGEYDHKWRHVRPEGRKKLPLTVVNESQNK